MKCGKCGSKTLERDFCLMCGETRDGLKGFVPDGAQIELPKAPQAWQPTRLRTREEIGLPETWGELPEDDLESFPAGDPDGCLPKDIFEDEEDNEMQTIGTCKVCERPNLSLAGNKTCSTCRRVIYSYPPERREEGIAAAKARSSGKPKGEARRKREKPPEKETKAPEKEPFNLLSVANLIAAIEDLYKTKTDALQGRRSLIVESLKRDFGA